MDQTVVLEVSSAKHAMLSEHPCALNLCPCAFVSPIVLIVNGFELIRRIRIGKGFLQIFNNSSEHLFSNSMLLTQPGFGSSTVFAASHVHYLLCRTAWTLLAVRSWSPPSPLPLRSWILPPTYKNHRTTAYRSLVKYDEPHRFQTWVPVYTNIITIKYFYIYNILGYLYFLLLNTRG